MIARTPPSTSGTEPPESPPLGPDVGAESASAERRGMACEIDIGSGRRPRNAQTGCACARRRGHRGWQQHEAKAVLIAPDWPVRFRRFFHIWYIIRPAAQPIARHKAVLARMLTPPTPVHIHRETNITGTAAHLHTPSPTPGVALPASEAELPLASASPLSCVSIAALSRSSTGRGGT